jgi:hypothetical protein
MRAPDPIEPGSNIASPLTGPSLPRRVADRKAGGAPDLKKRDGRAAPSRPEGRWLGLGARPPTVEAALIQVQVDRLERRKGIGAKPAMSGPLIRPNL